MISDSELSDDFSLDTVGSHGDVKCKGRYKDYLVRCCYSRALCPQVHLDNCVPYWVVFDFRSE